MIGARLWAWSGNMHDDGMNKDAPTIAYWPILMSHFESGDDKDDNVRRYVAYAIRSSRAGSESLMKDVRQAVWSVDANLPLIGCAHGGVLLLEIDGANVVHAGDAGSGGVDCAAAGRGGIVWRDCVFSVAAAGARSGSASRWGRSATILPACLCGRDCCLRAAAWCAGCLWPGRDAAAAVAAVSRKPDGSADVCMRGFCFVRGGGAGELCALAPDGLGESGRRVARGVRSCIEVRIAFPMSQNRDMRGTSWSRRPMHRDNGSIEACCYPTLGRGIRIYRGVG